MAHFMLRHAYLLNMKNAIIPEPFGVRCPNFQDFLVFMIPTPGKKIREIHDIWVKWSGWFDTELLPGKLFVTFKACEELTAIANGFMTGETGTVCKHLLALWTLINHRRTRARNSDFFLTRWWSFTSLLIITRLIILSNRRTICRLPFSHNYIWKNKSQYLLGNKKTILKQS